MLSGRYNHSIDDKGRIKIPQKIKNQIFITCCEYQVNSLIIRAFVDSGVDINDTNFNGRSGLHILCRNRLSSL